MIDFDLRADLDRIHSSFPPAKHRPIIGITTNYADGDASIRERGWRYTIAHSTDRECRCDDQYP